MARIRTVKQNIPASVRRELAARYGCKPGQSVPVSCAYCDAKGSIDWSIRRKQVQGWVSISGLEIDHVTPEFTGGETKAENMVLACQTCNRSKGHKSVDEWRNA